MNNISNIYCSMKKQKLNWVQRKFTKVVNGQRVQKQTGIEKKIEVLLRNIGLKFESESWLTVGKKNRKYDFFVNQGQLQFYIEADGDKWHAKDYKEGKVPYIKLSKIQKMNVRNDILKDRMAKEVGIPLIRLWETDINKNIGYCKEVVLAECKKQGHII